MQGTVNHFQRMIATSARLSDAASGSTWKYAGAAQERRSGVGTERTSDSSGGGWAFRRAVGESACRQLPAGWEQQGIEQANVLVRDAGQMASKPK